MKIQRIQKESNYIYFYFNKNGDRVPLIAGASLGQSFDFIIHPNDDMKKLLLDILPDKQLSTDIYIWVDGTEFKIEQSDYQRDKK